ATSNKPLRANGTSGSVVIGTTGYTNSNNTYYAYLYLNNNNWRARNNRGTSTSYTVYATQTSSSIDFSPYYLSNNLSSTPINSVYDTGDTDGPYMKFNSSNTSYFPLTVYEPGSDEVTKEGKTAYYPKKDKNNGNTGYIVSAATGPEENSTKDTSNRFRYLRSSTFAEYGQTGSGNSNGKIANSITSTGSGTSRKVTIDDSKVKTISQSGNVVTINKSDYVKYDSSKGKLENTLSGTDYVYGLHFTNEGKLGYVSMDNILKSKNVCIMDKEYTDGYELPVYCIDFNLKEKGYINFFAGSYNGSGAPGTGVDCFFSLNRIFRDPDNPKTIVDIKEIQKIYVNKSNDDWSCAYKYTDGTYSRPYRIAYIEDEEKNMMFDLDNTDLHPDPNDAIEELNNLTATQFNNYINNYNYVEEFDTTRLGDHDAIGSSSNGTSGFAGYIFYFEFPVNYGEYCLGNSRTGSEGAYLIYLDIGANGSEIKDKLYAYNIIVTQENVLYPLGVDFAAAGVTGNGGDTFCIYIESEDQGIVSFTFNDDKDDINITDASSITEYSYLSIGGYCTLSGNSPGGGLVTNPDKTYTRTCYIHTDPIDPDDPNSASHDIRIVDTLEKVTNGNVTTYTIVSTVYYVDDVETTEVNLYNAVPSLGARGMLALIRDRLIVISLELTNAKGVYDLDIVLEDLPWKDDQNNILTESPTTYKLTYTEENADFIITITSPDGLTIAVKVNGTQVNSGSTYHYTAPSNNP
ncbi:MAG: hypothetical protein J5666_05805, partial [Bacilli bacterium]|nr:hypothetical protein [Bacilli bacterium]